ncbi:ABC transporter permease [Neomicrococcus lactis]|uniref:ABC transporter permease n=1 Tax=Neomicrococcus lactis TaxID=732241 RepID=UPI0022FFFEDF|nr:ABC transporter permease [Neomicrococcus lactis]
MKNSLMLALKSVLRRWRRNLISLIVTAAGVAALVVLPSMSIGSSEAVSNRLDEATRSRITVLLPWETWERTEQSLIAPLKTSSAITDAGTLVKPERMSTSVTVRNDKGSDQSVQSTAGIATPSGLRTAKVAVRSGGIGADSVISNLPQAIYVGSRIARELGYSNVASGGLVIDGVKYSVLGIVSSEEAWISASVLFTPASAQTAGLTPNQRELTVAASGEVTEKLKKWIATAVSPANPEGATVLSAPSAQELRAEILERGNSLTTLIAIIAGVTGFLTLAATTFASLTERRREMGLYLALGYGTRFVASQIVVEGMIVGFLGGLTGFLVGTAIAGTISAFSFPLFFLPPVLLGLPLAGGLLGFLSALLPALAATRVAPSELLRD